MAKDLDLTDPAVCECFRELTKRIERLEKLLRWSKRQTAPFGKGVRLEERKKPGRKPPARRLRSGA